MAPARPVSSASVPPTDRPTRPDPPATVEPCALQQPVGTLGRLTTTSHSRAEPHSRRVGLGGLRLWHAEAITSVAVAATAVAIGSRGVAVTAVAIGSRGVDGVRACSASSAQPLHSRYSREYR